MLEKILSVISDDNGNVSSLRILSYIVVIVIMIKYLHTYVITYEEIGLVLGILGLKTVQKQIEKTECNTPS